VAFWTLGAIVLAAVVWGGAALLDVRMPWLWGGASGSAIVLPGLFWRPWFHVGVRAWNRGAWELARGLRAYVLLVLREGESPTFDRAVSSIEVPWYRALIGSARGWNAWVILLMPVLFLLFLLRVEHVEHAPPSGTYTLY
jgi:hypothetical protein